MRKATPKLPIAFDQRSALGELHRIIAREHGAVAVGIAEELLLLGSRGEEVCPPAMHGSELRIAFGPRGFFQNRHGAVAIQSDLGALVGRTNCAIGVCEANWFAGAIDASDRSAPERPEAWREAAMLVAGGIPAAGGGAKVFEA